MKREVPLPFPAAAPEKPPVDEARRQRLRSGIRAGVKFPIDLTG